MSSAAAQEALVVASFGRSVLVEDAAGARVLCHPRGKKNQALVGDKVLWRASEDEGVIEAVLPRRNVLYRQDELRTKSFAANLDQVLIWLAVEPAFSAQQLARILVACEEQGIPALIALNKDDLPGFAATQARMAPYIAMGYTVLHTSALAAERVRARLFPLLQGKRTFVMGPSGSGKSSLINALVPDAQVQTNTLSAALKTGKHTTTSTALYWLDGARTSALMDSPGFQEFGLAHISAQDLPRLMRDVAQAAEAGCKFYNCTHRHEPACAVRAAVQAGTVDAERYRIYTQLHEALSAAPRF